MTPQPGEALPLSDEEEAALRRFAARYGDGSFGGDIKRLLATLDREREHAQTCLMCQRADDINARAALAANRPDPDLRGHGVTPQPGEAPWTADDEYVSLRKAILRHGDPSAILASLERLLELRPAPVAGEGLTPYLFVSSCDWGDCHEPTIAIRHNDGEWLSVCRLHVADAEADEVAPIVSSLVAANQPVAEERT